MLEMRISGACRGGIVEGDIVWWDLITLIWFGYDMEDFFLNLISFWTYYHVGKYRIHETMGYCTTKEFRPIF